MVQRTGKQGDSRERPGENTEVEGVGACPDVRMGVFLFPQKAGLRGEGGQPQTFASVIASPLQLKSTEAGR